MAATPPRRPLVFAGLALGALLMAAATAVFFALRAPRGGADKGLLQELAAPAGAPLYVALAPIKDELVSSPEVAKLADELVRARLAAMGATVAPSGETGAAAEDAIRQRRAQGWMLQVKLRPEEVKGAPGMKMDVLCLTYPQQELRAQVNVRAGGASDAALVKAMVPRLLGDIAQECEWGQRTATK